MPKLDGQKFSYDKEGKKDFMEALKEKRSKQSAAEKNARAKATEKKKAQERRYKKSPNKRSSENYLKKRAPKANSIGGTQSGMRKYKKRAG
tara:strand:- start:34 stop:306 length:273 start_codon:yes stop_codon:yes gene_type:complete